MIIRIRMPMGMYRIDIDNDTDTISDIKSKIASKINTKRDNIIISTSVDYSNILVDDTIFVSFLSLSRGDILYARTINPVSNDSKRKDVKLSQVKKKWTFQELKDYELRNTHEIKGSNCTIKHVTIEGDILKDFIKQCRKLNCMRYAKLYGCVYDDKVIVKTMFIPEQVNHSDSCYEDPGRKRYYNKSLDCITSGLGLSHIGNITYFTDTEWKNSEYTLTLINRAQRDRTFVSLVARLVDNDISVEAFQASNECIDYYIKNIIYFKHASNKFTISKPHRIRIGSNTIENEIDIDFFITPIPITHKTGVYYVHDDLTFLDKWVPKRRYNLQDFRYWIMVHYPVKQLLLKKLVYDIRFLIYIKQWFNNRDFTLLLDGIRGGKVSRGHGIVICGICGLI